MMAKNLARDGMMSDIVRKILTEMALGAGSEVGYQTLRAMMELASDHSGQQD